MRPSFSRLFHLLAVTAAMPFNQAPGQAEIGQIMRNRAINWTDPQARAAVVEEIRAAEEANLQKAREIARLRGEPIRRRLPDGRLRELVGIDPDTGELLYYEPRNDIAAISTGVDQIQMPPFSLDGAGLRVGVWDGGSVLSSHQEFNEGAGSRINIGDGAASDSHATHVGGTIGAFGIVARAKGMAPQATIESYDWFSDVSEMTAASATGIGQFDSKVYLSNHSYGFSYGWRWDGSAWQWTGTGSTQEAYDADFGQYSGTTVNLDALAYNSRYYLIFWAGGNENNDGPGSGQSCIIGGSTVSYNPSIHPPNDGDYRNGFETIGDHGVAKNLITVGAANDAVTSGSRDPSRSTIASFSSTGPTDDGRIKPDLVANGVGLYSSVNSNDTAYGSSSGTSMASPNACGSAALLVDLYRDLYGGSAAMRSSTLKGLLIHTATDIGNPGPDYTYGWGLVDVKSAAELLQRQADFPDLESVVEAELSGAEPSQTYQFSWDGSSPIRATLCWTDPAGISQNAHDDRSPDLVNDLDLKLIAPDGSEYYPFVMPFVGTWTAASMGQNATTGVNRVDNVEQVLITTPAQSGLWQAVVTHEGSLTSGAQEFGLILSGAGTAGALIFDTAETSVGENAGSVTVTVRREGGSTGAASVNYATTDGTAVSGADYVETMGSLEWADGETDAKTIEIPIVNDTQSEDYEESFSITLSDPTGAEISDPATMTVTILDDETTLGVIYPNGGEELGGNTTANLSWTSSLGGNVRIELLRNDLVYTIITASTANDGSFAWAVPPSIPTADTYRIRIVSLESGADHDTSNTTFSVNNLLTGVDIYTADMESDPGWTLQGDWAWGKPSGGGGQYGNPDPTAGNTGENVVGFNLLGDYANSLGEVYATTPPIDCSGNSEVELNFARWLNVETNTYDNARIRVSNDGTTWTEVWANPSQITDNAWTPVSYDISAVADGQSTVYVRWVMGSTDGSWQFSGWNLDDVTLSGLGSYVNPAGEIAFRSSVFTASEGSGTATIIVDRLGGAVGDVSVDYATAAGTATSTADYTDTSGTLTWSDGDNSPKTFEIAIIDDADHEDLLETVQLTLSHVVGATLPDNAPVTLNIEDDDNNTPSVDAGEDQLVEWQTMTTVPGLYYGTVPGNIDTSTPNPQSQILIDVASQTENSIATNTTEIYTGRIYDADGQISFTEHIDDKARIWIDGTPVISDDNWRNRTSTPNLNLAPGWHTIEIRISNGTGGSGPNTGVGIGYDPNGGTTWQTLVDPGDGSLLRTNQNIPGAETTLNGSSSDLDGDPLTHTWELVSGPAPVTIADSSSLSTSVNFEATGVYTFRLTADDGRDTATDEIVITVELPVLAVTITEAEFSENGGSSTLSVSRGGTQGELEVTLVSSDPSEASVPATATILDGQDTVAVSVTGVDDSEVDGPQTVTITASASGFQSRADSVVVTDDDVLTFSVLYDGNGNDGGAVPVDENAYTENSLVTVFGNPGNLVRTGYDFAGWNTAGDGSGVGYTASDQFNILADVTLYAQWETVYADWASTFGGTLENPAPAVDFDQGGIETGLEWVYGGDPTSMQDDSSIAPVVDANDPEAVTFTFRRSDQAEADPNTSITVEYGSDLSAWTEAVPNGSSIIMSVTDDHYGPGVDRVVFRIDWDHFSGNQAFIQIRADVGP
jgi:uncharacterized repeat protein (TIGR02543 family)